MRTARMTRRVPVDVRRRPLQVRPEDVAPTGRQVGQALYLYQHSNDQPALLVQASDATFNPSLIQVLNAAGDIKFLITVAGAARFLTSTQWRDGSAADASVQITPQTAALLFGDGTNSPDWQMSRTAADTVTIASGDILKGDIRNTGSFLVSSITSAVSIANSSTETQLIGLTVPAGAMAAGTSFFFEADGIAGTTVLAPTMTWRVRIGTASLSGNVAASWAPTPSAGLSGKGWQIQGIFTVRSSGGSGTCLANGLNGNSLGATLGDTVLPSAQTATVAVDTTVSNVLEATFKFGTADAANTLTCANAGIWLVKS